MLGKLLTRLQKRVDKLLANATDPAEIEALMAEIDEIVGSIPENPF